MRFVWFWTFWYWSKEGFRSGSLLRGPLDGVGGHWDEWYRHEASEGDRRAIQDAGRTPSGQRQFVVWLLRHWARESGRGEDRIVARFVLRQLAQLPPFDSWAGLKRYRKTFGGRGVSAIVLAEDSPGQMDDVRPLESVLLPAESKGEEGSIVPQGFHVDESELDTIQSAASSVLSGRGLLALLCSWLLAGRRPYPRFVRAALLLAWLSVGGLVLYLLLGPDPGGRLFPIVASLVGGWGGLVLISGLVTGKVCLDAWFQGKRMSRRLKENRVRLWMESGLTLKGCSAGLPFCLNVLSALHGADPRGTRRSWLWLRFFESMRSSARSWAATGVVTADGRVRPVVVGPKLRACVRHPEIEGVLTPRQKGIGRRAIRRLAESLSPSSRESAVPSSFARSRLGFAAEPRRLEARSCSSVAQAVLTLGGLRSRFQMAVNLLVVFLSAVVFCASPDERRILLPPAVPALVGPSSPSPYFLWVSLDTEHPESFFAVLESEFWSNRRVEVAAREGDPSPPRAEIRLHRLARPASHDEESGIVWIERRHRFLGREFAPGERVGRYTFTYLCHVGHE